MENLGIYELHPAFAQALEDRLFAQAYRAKKASQNLALTIQRVRRQRGLTQETLAKRIGSTQPSLSRLENGKVLDVGFDLIRRIGEAMEMEAQVVFKPQSSDEGGVQQPGGADPVL